MLRTTMMRRGFRTVSTALALTLLHVGVLGAQARARDLGIPFQGDPGPLNAITDVTGVQVGHTTIVRGDGALVVGEGPVRTGVTAILPRTGSFEPVFAGWYALNGNGEMTGTTWVEESGFLEGPVMITNTHSVGIVHDADGDGADGTDVGRHGEVEQHRDLADHASGRRQRVDAPRLAVRRGPRRGGRLRKAVRRRDRRLLPEAGNRLTLGKAGRIENAAGQARIAAVQRWV